MIIQSLFIWKLKKKLSSLVNAWCKLIALLQMFRCCEILLRKQVNHENVRENSSQKPRQLKYMLKTDRTECKNDKATINRFCNPKNVFVYFFSNISWTRKWIWFFNMIFDLLIKSLNSRRKKFLLHDCELLFLMLKFSTFYISNPNIKKD